MKKIAFFLFLTVPSHFLQATVVCDVANYLENKDAAFSLALSSGFVFKHHDCLFKQVYGRGIVDILTVDGCYYPWESWGIGAKASYWRAKGKTTFFKKCTRLHEIPLTFYVRKTFDCWCNLQAYASLGGGIIWMEEKSYLGRVRKHKGIGEVEVGLNYPIWNCLNITGAFRYLFPREKICSQKANVGGFDVRAGVGVTF